MPISEYRKIMAKKKRGVLTDQDVERLKKLIDANKRARRRSKVKKAAKGALKGVKVGALGRAAKRGAKAGALKGAKAGALGKMAKKLLAMKRRGSKSSW